MFIKALIVFELVSINFIIFLDIFSFVVVTDVVLILFAIKLVDSNMYLVLFVLFPFLFHESY